MRIVSSYCVHVEILKCHLINILVDFLSFVLIELMLINYSIHINQIAGINRCQSLWEKKLQEIQNHILFYLTLNLDHEELV